jgi:hypothetical protein
MENKKVLKIQEALREYKDKNEAILKVSSKYDIKVKYHSTYKNLVLFKYSQRGSDFKYEIVRESRGVILDQNNNWEVVAWPYLKFFNFNEPYACTIDWGTATVVEKCDGSLMTLYWYRDAWHVSSSGIPDATGPCNSGSNFQDLFWRIWNKKKMTLPDVEDRDKCFMFELLSDEQIIVVRPEEEALILHGCRNVLTLNEIQPQIMADKYGWPIVKKYPMTNIDEVISFSKTLDPTKAEGFVICDANFNRVKVKTPQYVAVAHLNIRDTSGLNFGNMIKIVNENEGSEFLNYLILSFFSLIAERCEFSR